MAYLGRGVIRKTGGHWGVDRPNMFLTVIVSRSRLPLLVQTGRGLGFE
jgi:hypothetical protein